jgi:hypothetical protein
MFSKNRKIYTHQQQSRDSATNYIANEFNINILLLQSLEFQTILRNESMNRLKKEKQPNKMGKIPDKMI